jgi:hypothetical protein
MLLQRFTIRVCRALLQFPPQASLAVLRFPPRRPLLHHVGWTNHHASSHSSEQGTQHIVLLISRQAIPYRTRDGTCCPGLPTPKIRYKLFQHYLPLSSIPGEGEYRPPLEDCLRASESLSEALASTSNKTLLVLIFADPHLRPLTLVEHGARCIPVFCGALVPYFLFLAGGAGTRGGASAWVGTSRLATCRRALAFKGKPNNSRKQVQQNKY